MSAQASQAILVHLRRKARASRRVVIFGEKTNTGLLTSLAHRRGLN
jgi:hypothetical protein